MTKIPVVDIYVPSNYINRPVLTARVGEVESKWKGMVVVMDGPALAKWLYLMYTRTSFLPRQCFLTFSSVTFCEKRVYFTGLLLTLVHKHVKISVGK